jgi:hypothetical protein
MAVADRYPKAQKKLSTLEAVNLVEEVRDNIEEGYLYDRDNRREALIDLQFLAGDQWPENVKAIRGTKRPMLTVNRLPQFVRQVTNPTRDADIAIKVTPVGEVKDPALANIFNGVIKQIEYQSTAKTVYVTGNEHQAGCGIGWWQVLTEYVDDANFLQEIRLRSINNPLSVICDPAAIMPTREDAMWIAVLEQWPLKAFKRRYPNAACESVDTPDQNSRATFRWSTSEIVTLAMYYRKVPTEKLLALHQSGRVTDITRMGEAEVGQLDAQDPITNTRRVHTHRIEKYLVSGSEVLEGPIAWAGKYIPLVPVIGAETPLPTGQFRYGIVRFARDPQQMLNFYRTATAEAIALAPKTPYLVTIEQIGEFREYWDTLNTENRPYLPYKPDPLVQGNRPVREHAPEPPVALIQGANEAGEDLKSVTGIYDATLGAKSNETSGIAIQRRDAQGDNANSHFADNLMHSLVHTGRILIDLIPKIYDTERVLQIMDEAGVAQEVTINQVLYAVDGTPVLANDLNAGRFDVRVTVGRGYATRRLEALGAMLEFAKSLPPQAQLLLLDLIAKNSDWPDAEQVARRFRTLIPPAALADPNDPNAPPPPGPLDDPQVKAQVEKLWAEIEKLRADAIKTLADATKTTVEADQLDAQPGIIQLPEVAGDWQSLLASAPESQGPPGQPGGPPEPPQPAALN